MGSTNPFFKAAGMTEYPVPHAPNDYRLLDTLHHLNLTANDLLSASPTLPPSPSLLGEGRGEGSHLSSYPSPTPLPNSSPSQLHPLLRRELQTWARTKRLDPHNPNLPAYAAFKLLTQPRAYTHVHKQHKEQRA